MCSLQSVLNTEKGLIFFKGTIVSNYNIIALN